MKTILIEKFTMVFNPKTNSLDKCKPFYKVIVGKYGKRKVIGTISNKGKMVPCTPYKWPESTETPKNAMVESAITSCNEVMDIIQGVCGEGQTNEVESFLEEIRENTSNALIALDQYRD